MKHYFRFLLFAISVLLFTIAGCDSKDSAGLKIDLTQLNWQTAALIGIAYFANSRGHLATLATTIRNILQTIGILKKDGPELITADEIAKKISELLLLLNGKPELQTKVIELMTAVNKEPDYAKPATK